LSLFSKRTSWELTPNRFAQALDARKRRGARILDLTESNPTRAGLRCPPDLLCALADPEVASYDPQPTGLHSTRAAVAADFARRGLLLAADRLILASSTSEAYGLLFKLLCDPGDAVLLPRPSYPLFDYLAGLESVTVGRYDLCYDGEWHIDFAALSAALHERTRAILLVHPNNPTGSYLKQDELERLIAVCVDHRLAIISDEVFCDYPLRADARRVLSLAEDRDALAFTLGGLSKSCGLPQMKLAWIAVTGPPALRRTALARLEIVADTYLSVGTPVQQAAARFLAEQTRLRAPISARIEGNLCFLRESLERRSATSVLDAEGGWYAILRVPATRSEEDYVVGLIERRGIVVHPGYFFDFPSEAYLVVSLLTEGETFRAGVRGLAEEFSVDP
jgi:hypothetical protein